MELNNLEKATLGGGCFWCTEAIFDELRGVKNVASGYSGGRIENPTYEQVCTDTTGHAEVVQITFDQNEISFDDVLKVFFATHNPTTLNAQGNDVGSNYRSVIFYHSPEQREIAERISKQLTDEDIFDKPIVTEITEFTKFYPAEDDHKEYFANNPNQPYCASVVAPKVAKFRKRFLSKLKK